MEKTDFEKMRLKNEQYRQNAAPRLPVCFCIDSSYSMINNGMSDINNGMVNFIKETQKDIYAVDSVELCIVSFGGNGIKIECEFSPLKDIEYEPLIPQGTTPLGDAIKFALEKIDSKLEAYELYGLENYRPWLIIISDGKADDNSYKSVAKIIRERQEKNQLKVLAIALGNEETSLSEFTLDSKIYRLDVLKSTKIKKFFSWLSKSMSVQSKSAAFEDEDLPTDEWASTDFI